MWIPELDSSLLWLEYNLSLEAAKTRNGVSRTY